MTAFGEGEASDWPRRPMHACGVWPHNTNCSSGCWCCNARKERKIVWRIFDLPMHQYTSSLVKPLLDESNAGGEMLNDVLVFHVIELDDVVLEVGEEIIVKRQPQHRYYMCDIGLVQGFFAPQGE